MSHHWVWKSLKVKGSEMGMGIGVPQSYWAIICGQDRVFIFFSFSFSKSIFLLDFLVGVLRKTKIWE